jgi:alpha-1,6-mannosyltransferase
VSVLAVGRARVERRFETRTAVGVAALAASVAASAWIAVGAAGGTYLLQLPTSANPRWIDGPLRGLAGALGPHGLSVALAVLVAAYVVALGCAGAIPVRVTLGAVVLANVAFTLGPTLVSTDVFGYVAYAREAAVHGLNPYVAAPASIPHDPILQFVYWKGQPSPYGPLFTILSLPLGVTSPMLALWSYKALVGAASIALVMLAVAIARDRGVNPARAAVFVGINPVLLFYAVSGAHNDLLAALLVALAVLLVVRRREAAGGATAVAALAIKVTLGLALPFVIVGARRRGAAVRGIAVAFVAVGIPTLLLFGPHVLDQVHRIASERLFDTAFSGPDRLAAVLGTHIGPAIRLTCAAAALAVAVATIIWASRGGDWIAAAGWALLALVWSIASLAPWYLVWVLPLAAAGGSRSLRVAAVLATLYLVAVHLPALGGRPWLTPAASAPARTTPLRNRKQDASRRPPGAIAPYCWSVTSRRITGGGCARVVE